MTRYIKRPKPTYEFNLAKSIATRDEILRRVDWNTDSNWKILARIVVLIVAHSMDVWTSDDVWEFGGLPETHNNHSLGPVIGQLSREGIIEKTGRQRLSNRPRLHASPRTEWRLK